MTAPVLQVPSVWLWQVSAVSKKLALAAEAVVFSSEGLDLTSGAIQQLDSALLLGWAPLVQVIHLDDSALSIPGLSAFVQACTSLKDMEVEIQSVRAAAQAGHMLRRSKTPRLRISGCAMPSALPHALDRLQITLNDEDAGFDPQMPSACLYVIADQQRLKCIYLDLDECCSIQLICPHTHRAPLKIEVSLGLYASTDLDLSWLQVQPCSCLTLRIQICTERPAQHQKLVSILRQLQVHHLVLFWRVGMPLELQRCWAQVNPINHVGISFLDHNPFATAATSLQVLPSCHSFGIIAEEPELGDLPIYVSWSSLRRPGKICMHLSMDLRILGAGETYSTPAAPWQLEVFTSEQVHGLRGSQAMVDGQVQCWQNSAAIAAGWTIFYEWCT